MVGKEKNNWYNILEERPIVALNLRNTLILKTTKYLTSNSIMWTDDLHVKPQQSSVLLSVNQLLSQNKRTQQPSESASLSGQINIPTEEAVFACVTRRVSISHCISMRVKCLLCGSSLHGCSLSVLAPVPIVWERQRAWQTRAQRLNHGRPDREEMV